MIDPMLLGGLTAAAGALAVHLSGRRRPAPAAPPTPMIRMTRTTTTVVEHLELPASSWTGQHPIQLPQWTPQLEAGHR